MGIDQWISSRSKPMRPWSVLGRMVHGVVSWNMNDTCNYRCSYCTQRHMPDRSGAIIDVEDTVGAFRQLRGCWEFKLSGGEPFRQPGLCQIVRCLVEMGHIISIQTNFSADQTLLREFLTACDDALHVFSASLHLDYATPDQFVQKYRLIKQYGSPKVLFNVTSVGVPERLEQLKNEVAPFFSASWNCF